MARIEINVITGNIELHPDVDPPPPDPVQVPNAVSRRQFKRGLLNIGMLDAVESAVASSGDRSLQIDWAEAQYVERTNPFVTQLATSLGKSESDIDALFIMAAGL